MNRRASREINVLSMSALDLFASALGVFILMTVLSFKPPAEEKQLSVVFVVDATDSMADLVPEIAAAIAGSVEMLRQAVPGLAVGAVAYRDRAERFLTRELPLGPVESTTAARLATFLEEAAAEPRGDNYEREEAVGAGLANANARRFRAGSPGRRVHAVFCRSEADDHASFFRAIAEAGGGRCVPPMQMVELVAAEALEEQPAD